MRKESKKSEQKKMIVQLKPFSKEPSYCFKEDKKQLHKFLVLRANQKIRNLDDDEILSLRFV